MKCCENVCALNMLIFLYFSAIQHIHSIQPWFRVFLYVQTQIRNLANRETSFVASWMFKCWELWAWTMHSFFVSWFFYDLNLTVAMSASNRSRIRIASYEAQFSCEKSPWIGVFDILADSWVRHTSRLIIIEKKNPCGAWGHEPLIPSIQVVLPSAAIRSPQICNSATIDIVISKFFFFRVYNWMRWVHVYITYDTKKSNDTKSMTNGLESNSICIKLLCFNICTFHAERTTISRNKSI